MHDMPLGYFPRFMDSWLQIDFSFISLPIVFISLSCLLSLKLHGGDSGFFKHKTCWTDNKHKQKRLSLFPCKPKRKEKLAHILTRLHILAFTSSLGFSSSFCHFVGPHLAPQVFLHLSSIGNVFRTMNY